MKCWPRNYGEPSPVGCQNNGALKPYNHLRKPAQPAHLRTMAIQGIPLQSTPDKLREFQLLIRHVHEGPRNCVGPSVGIQGTAGGRGQGLARLGGASLFPLIQRRLPTLIGLGCPPLPISKRPEEPGLDVDHFPIGSLKCSANKWMPPRSWDRVQLHPTNKQSSRRNAGSKSLMTS